MFVQSIWSIDHSLLIWCSSVITSRTRGRSCGITHYNSHVNVEIYTSENHIYSSTHVEYQTSRVKILQLLCVMNMRNVVLPLEYTSLETYTNKVIDFIVYGHIDRQFGTIFSLFSLYHRSCANLDNTLPMS